MKSTVLLVMFLIFGSVIPIRGNTPVKKGYQEKVYLHTDKPYYLKGDTIWLKGYLVDARTHRMQDAQSRFLYIELINRKNKVVQRKKLKGDGGRFHNFIALGKDIEESEYQLRAYTNYMRNAGEEFFFTQQISVYADAPSLLSTQVRYEKNNLGDDYVVITLLRREGTPYAGNRVEYLIRSKEYENHFRRSHTNDSGELYLKLPTIEKGVEPYVYITLYENKYKLHKRINLKRDYEYTVGFYPEGGHLIAGVEQTVGFKAESSTGELVHVSGFIINQRKDTLARLQSEYAGIGAVKLRASIGDTLWACVKDDRGNTKQIRLPMASDKHVAISVRREGNELRYRLLYPEHSPSDEAFGLLVHTRGRVIRNDVLSRHAPSGTLSCDSLPEGITHFAIYNKDTVVVSERLVFVRKPNPVFQLTASSLPDEGRMPVKMGLKVMDSNFQPLQGNFSLSVTDDYAVTVHEERQNLPSYLLLSSDLRGSIHNPGYYLTGETEEITRHTDQLMLTHGWRSYDVTNRNNGTMRNDTAYAIERVQQISGYAETHFNHKRLENMSLLVENLTDESKIVVTTGYDGRFSFRLDLPQKENLLTELVVHGYGKKPKWRYGVYLDKLAYPAVTDLHWKTEQPSKVDSAYIQDVREGYTLVNGEKVYKIPEVEVTALELPGNWISYNVVETERIEQVDKTNALDLIATLPGIVVETDMIDNQLKIYTPTRDVFFGKSMRTFLQKKGSLHPYSWKKVPVLVDGKTIGNVYDLENLQAKDIKSIDFVRDQAMYALEAKYDIDTWEWDDNFMNEKDYYENRIDTDSIEGIGIPGVYLAQPQKIYIRTYLSQGILESSVPSVARVGYLSYAPDATFYSPQYATTESRKIVNSDKRSTLYWEPDIRLNDKGEVGFSFYTADRPSTYTVVIEGVTTDGKACRYVKTIR